MPACLWSLSPIATMSLREVRPGDRENLWKMNCRFPIHLSLRLPMVLRTNSSGLVFRRLSISITRESRASKSSTVASLPLLQSAVAVQVWLRYEPRTLTLDAVDFRDREAIAQALRPLYLHSGAMDEAFRAAAVDKALWPHVRSGLFLAVALGLCQRRFPGFVLADRRQAASPAP